ncbi:PIN/TRAM domain-containing protein [Ruminiclostridium herbifermentans]|uniref:PIN/TRAM domain-containing protein n=1 Tax=Ruminiclostridium herbifermentans TaxID=2488810 RepID=A0A4U7JHG9_9FIRM|nr:PIN domain-containing protein [Ruminiclostridium herbifermentans]QNU67549.1 PIN/TRAM domain-containing protein [Ruminiclostridium herbifermentans]
MLNRIIKASFSILGAVTGYSILRTIFNNNSINVSESIRISIFVIFSLFFCAVFYFISAKIIEFLGGFIDKFESRIQNITLSELLICAIGLILGLIVANLISIPILKIEILGVTFAVLINILLGFAGVALALRKKNDIFSDFFKDSKSPSKSTSLGQSKLLDTSTIIDGRILDIYSTGFVDGHIIIPSFVLEELRHIADSTDSTRRARGRRGLDILNLLQKDNNYVVRIADLDYKDIQEVDEMLLKASLELKCKLVTTDYNLSKVARLRGIEVLNINDLANAVKPVALPGEEMNVQIIKAGKEAGQGVAFLDDGTMIVVEDGKKYVGEAIQVIVTSVLQTSAGRLIFAKPDK